jgi:hypothetical protein
MTRKKKKTVNQAEIKRMKKLRQGGHSIEAIAEKLNRDLRTVRKYLGIVDSKGEETKFLKEDHLKRVIAQVDSIRSCLEHPTLNGLPERELLEIREHNWQLDPMMWFYLCTPSFTRKDWWGSEFPMLESHMKESSFWEHLQQLKQTVIDLEKDYDRIALKLFKDDQHFEEFWKSIQFERLKRESDWGYKPSRTPHTPEPSPEELTPYYDQKYAKEVIERFIGIASDLLPRQLEIEKMLDQLNNDLLPDEINPIIVRGHCEKCP